jgi:ElaB/YqjD/DUF883 family membrane-anchored ribosome-binding protein
MNTLYADATKQRLMGEIDAVVGQTEELLKTVAHAGNTEVGAFRASVEQSIAVATERLAQIRVDALERAGIAAKATDDYLHGRPWQAVGIVAAVAAIAGLLAGLLLSRR